MGIASWHAARLQALSAEEGWLNLTDRVEIAPGTYSVGRAGDIALSTGPEHLGTLTLAPDGRATLDGAPFGNGHLRRDGLLLEITVLEGQHALRVRDLARPRVPPVIPLFPEDPFWRISALWEALPAPERLTIGTMIGVETSVPLTHRARFHHAGEEVTLLPTHWKEGRPLFVFRDTTAGRETYAAARFLLGDVDGDRVVLDFNRAFNPPCAFTDLATCPLPPAQNRLPFAIRAGERAPQGHRP